MKNMLTKLVVILLTVGIVGCTNGNNQTTGAVTGAVAGGLLGGALGGGTAGVVGGAIAGGLVGGVIGNNMDQNDRMRASSAVSTGRTTYWVNKRTGMRYKVVMDSRVTVNGNPNCRRFHTVMMSRNGHKSRTHGVACMAANGNWYTMR